MSIDYHAHIGPYLRCQTKMVTVSTEERGCPKCKRTASGSQNYCEDCGTAVGDIQLSEVRPEVEPLALSEKIREAMWHPTMDPEITDGGVVHFWLPNFKPKGYRTFNAADHQEGVEDLSSIDVQKDSLAFARQFSDAIKTLESAYGADNVAVQWGLVKTAT